VPVIETNKRRSWRGSVFWAVLWLLFWLPGLVGCRTAGAARSGPVAVKQTGPAAIPATADQVTSRASVPLPAGTEIKVSQPAGPDLRPDSSTAAAGSGVSVILPAPSVLTVETVSNRVSGPQSFSPPSPPSPVEIAAGKAAWLYRVGLLVGIAAGVFGLVRGWDFVMYGGAAVAAACGFGMFAESHPVLLFVIGGGVVLAVVGPLLWHWKLKHQTGGA